MKVVIVAKTKMKAHECVGGIVIENEQFVRILTEYGNNQPPNCDYEVGDIWDIQFTARTNCISPHTEDVLVHSCTFFRKVISIKKLTDWVIKKFPAKVWRGDADVLFDGMITFPPSGPGFLSKENDSLDYSVGFWISDIDLLKDNNYKDRIAYGNIFTIGVRELTYVGLQEPVNRIPAGSLLRVSLARWWTPEASEDEDRCYLQLSGWFAE